MVEYNVLFYCSVPCTRLRAAREKGNTVMTINVNREGKVFTVSPEGRLDTTTAPEFEKAIRDGLEGTEELVLDLKNLEYISSAGLRVLLSSEKAMAGKGSMKVRNVCAAVMEIFDITGFSDILTIE